MKTTEDLINEAKELFKFYSSEAEKLKQIIDSAESTKPKLFQSISNGNGRVKLSFEGIILNILSDGSPRTTRMLMEEVEARTGNTSLNRKGFSSRLAIFSKNKRLIRNCHFEEAPNNSKYWWGKSDWFNGNFFTPEYLKRIPKELIIKQQKETMKTNDD